MDSSASNRLFVRFTSNLIDLTETLEKKPIKNILTDFFEYWEFKKASVPLRSYKNSATPDFALIFKIIVTLQCDILFASNQ